MTQERYNYIINNFHNFSKEEYEEVLKELTMEITTMKEIPADIKEQLFSILEFCSEKMKNGALN